MIAHNFTRLDWHESIVAIDNHGGCERSLLHESHANEWKLYKSLVATLRRQFSMLQILKTLTSWANELYKHRCDNETVTGGQQWIISNVSLNNWEIRGRAMYRDACFSLDPTPSMFIHTRYYTKQSDNMKKRGDTKRHWLRVGKVVRSELTIILMTNSSLQSYLTSRSYITRENVSTVLFAYY